MSDSATAWFSAIGMLVVGGAGFFGLLLLVRGLVQANAAAKFISEHGWKVFDNKDRLSSLWDYSKDINHRVYELEKKRDKK